MGCYLIARGPPTTLDLALTLIHRLVGSNQAAQMLGLRILIARHGYGPFDDVPFCMFMYGLGPGDKSDGANTLSGIEV